MTTYRAPLVLIAIVLALLALDYRFRATADYYTTGMRALAAGKSETAIAAFGQALQLNPSDAATRLGLGKAYQSLGWTGEAIKQYEMSAQKANETLKETERSLREANAMLK